MHKEDIKAAIRKRGTTMRALSLSAGLSRDAVCKSLEIPFPSANRAVAKFLGKPLHAIWPKWYDFSGKTLMSPSQVKSSRKRRSRHCKNQRGLPHE